MEECHKMLTDQIKWENLEGNQVRIDFSRPLPLGGPPGHVTIQSQFCFNKDLDHLRYGNKGSRLALSISKMKAARYPDFGLELLVPEQMWIDEVCTYDRSAIYGISHWWFNRQKFYIKRHESLSRRREVKKYMQILSVVRIKAFSRYRFQEPASSDFENLNLLLLQGHLDHLLDSDKPLDYRVKEFKLKRLNPGMNTWFWTQKDVTRSKEFISAIERRLKTRRIYRNLECFIGGRVYDIDYRLIQRT
nr:hypothetical protein [Tanacetum cinerariifolium]